METKNYILLFFFASVISMGAWGQGHPDYESGLKVKINESGSRYFRLLTWGQFWLKYNENNTGSTLAGEPESTAVDFAIRRVRLLTYAQLTDKFIIVTHFGINNQNTFSGGAPGMGSKKPQLFLHDAYAEHKIWKDYISIGAGLHYWNGISRMTNTSTLNFLAIDAPIFNWTNIDKSDQFGRYLGFYLKGKIKKFDYRIAVNDGFQANDTKAIFTNVAEYNPHAKWMTAGYFNYQFLDQESNLLPYMVGTYLGSKKVLNVGVGFQHQKNAMWLRDFSGDTLSQDQFLFGADVFLDMPLGKKKDAITFYGAYYNFEMGRNYVRHIGILNTTDGGGALRGNAVPTVGTGSILYGQLGYLVPSFSKKLQIQPYVSYSYARFKGLRDANDDVVPVNILEGGVNFYMAGHHAKWTVNYRLRPDFTDVNNLRNRNELTLQLMVYL
jgi:hypothetical protein